MGWISRRHMQTGGSIGGMKGRKHKGPLREIVETIHPAQGMFSPARVRLSCGHETNSDGYKRARCRECARPEGRR